MLTTTSVISELHHEAEAEALQPILDLAARNPRAAMEAFAGMYTSAETLAPLASYAPDLEPRPILRELI